jgi:hypothetical protein
MCCAVDAAESEAGYSLDGVASVDDFSGVDWIGGEGEEGFDETVGEGGGIACGVAEEVGGSIGVDGKGRLARSMLDAWELLLSCQHNNFRCFA